MYQSHWGLRESPFRGALVWQFLQKSPTHEEALARMHFLVDNHRRMGLLMGPSGSGKSLLLELFAGQVNRRGLPVVKINLFGVEPAEILWLLAAGLKLNPHSSIAKAELWRMIIDRLAEFHYQQLHTVILLDDADSAHEDVLTQVTRLARHDGLGETRLTMILAGRQEKMRRLGEQLLELIELRIDLEPWEPLDTANFLKYSLTAAGQKSPVFSPQAVARLHELAQGIPRRVSQLADLSLLAGAGQNLQQIDAQVVESVYQELCPAQV